MTLRPWRPFVLLFCFVLVSGFIGCTKPCPDCPDCPECPELPTSTGTTQRTVLSEDHCTADYAMGKVQYRYEVNPAQSAEDKYVLRCGPEGDTELANKIEVTPNSCLRLVNGFDQYMFVAVGVGAEKTLFGFQAAPFTIPPKGHVDLRIQPTAEKTGAYPYVVKISTRPNKTSLESKELYAGDPDPKLHVKDGG